MWSLIRGWFGLLYFPLMAIGLIVEMNNPSSALPMAIGALLVVGVLVYFANPPDRGG